MRSLFHFALFSTLVLTACNNKKNTTTGAAPAPAAAPVAPLATNPPAATIASPAPTQQIGHAPGQSGETIRYVVSFYSMASGIDTKVNEEFVNFLDAYPKKINYEPKHWGREGEIDYCLSLIELSPTEQTEFIKKAKAILAKSSLVHQKENAQCEHANWPPLMINNTKSSNYPIIVSFTSKASGIDTKAHEEFQKFLSTYPKKIVFEPTHWGREGETDYCLKLNELSMGEQTDFINKVKKLLAKSSLVIVSENAECVHKH